MGDMKLIKNEDGSYVYGDYVLTPCKNAFNNKISYWLSKRDCTVAVYSFTPIDRHDTSEKGIKEHIEGSISVLENRLHS